MTCSVGECQNPVRYKGMCGKHYKRWWRHGNPDHTDIVMHNGTKCSVEDCSRAATIKDLCSMHNTRQQRYGRTNNIRADKGMGRPKTAAGYVVITTGNGRRVYEHIFLAECALGKPLPAKAIVHHMNNIPDDNFTPLNLVICPDQAYHMLLHKRARDLG
jgi:hypothetical protein